MEVTLIDIVWSRLHGKVLGITVRDVQIQKPGGSIDFTLRVRHFQVDAMLPSARYPIIIQPLPLGVDRREPLYPECEGVLDSNTIKRDCYWENHNEKPIPLLGWFVSCTIQTTSVILTSRLIACLYWNLLLELTGSYVPQVRLLLTPHHCLVPLCIHSTISLVARQIWLGFQVST